MVAWVHIYVPGVTVISNLGFTEAHLPTSLNCSRSTSGIIFKSLPSLNYFQEPTGAAVCLSDICPLGFYVASASFCQSSWGATFAGHHGLPPDTTAKRCQGHIGFCAVVAEKNASSQVWCFGEATKLPVASILKESELGWLLSQHPPVSLYTLTLSIGSRGDTLGN